MSELKPCPFCGGEAKYSAVLVAFEGEQHWVQCQKCLMHIWEKTKAKVIKAWNTRASSELVEAAEWAFDYVKDGCDPEEGEIPKHECGFAGPDADCDFHRDYFKTHETLAALRGKP